MFNPCIIIPVYNHEKPLAEILARLADHGLPCILVDDGSDTACAKAIADLAAERPWIEAIRHSHNRGKGGAVKTALLAAQARGYSHALQLDADGQHDLNDVTKFLETARAHPEAVVIGNPTFDASVPKGRYYARYLTHVWVWINTLSFAIPDAMCGFRVYPVGPCFDLIQRRQMDERMAFDVEILIRLYSQGLEFIPLPTRVGYPKDGISHFRLWEDNLRLSLMQARFFLSLPIRLPALLARRFR